MTDWRALLPEAPGRAEALLALVRAFVLVFAAASTLSSPLDEPVLLPALQVLVAAASTAAAAWLWRLGPAGSYRASLVATAVDLALVTAYCAAVAGRPAAGALYPAFVIVTGPLRWGLRGALVTGVPVALVVTVWPVQDAGGTALEGVLLWLMTALLALPVAGLSAVWRRNGALLRQAQERLSYDARHDPLTGLPNRVQLLADLERALASQQQLALLFLDLDRFKVVNDGLGHAAGDRLLAHVASRLAAAVRPGDVVARFGGDEFVVLCRGVADEASAVEVGERVLAALRAPVVLDGRSPFVPGGSAGVAVAGPGSTAEELLRDADAAMYAAKAAGGGRALAADPAQHRAARDSHELEADLRRALAEGAVTVVYQPVVDLAVGRVSAVEALARWTDPERGEVPPSQFVEVAEQSSLVDELGAHVLDLALAQAATWPGGHDPAPAVAVNAALRQVLDPGFRDTVAKALQRHGVPAGRLVLELTETALVRDMRELVPAMQALRALGVRLAIDDFGTGHASLTYLASLPVDVVKVDRSFVAGVADDAGSSAIVGGVVAMAGAFGLTVVAEGVETEAQLTTLRRLGVERVQGFLLSRPLGGQELRAALASGTADRVPAPRAPVEPAVADDPAQRLRLLLDAARDVTACTDVDEVMQASFRALRRTITFTGGSIQLVEGDVIRMAAADPPPPPEALLATLPVGSGVGGSLVVSGEPRYLPDITIVAAVAPKGRRRVSGGVRSWYGVPLVAEGRIIGLLQVDSTTVDAFDETDRLLVLSFAPMVAAAVQSARRVGVQLRALHGG